MKNFNEGILESLGTPTEISGVRDPQKASKVRPCRLEDVGVLYR